MLTLLVALQLAAPGRRAVVQDTLPFAKLVEQVSESGGYFDTDNLISNESSYLHVLGTIRTQGGKGGAYVGVGPDQNFSYIAAVRPSVAFIVDLRRDNLLLHLLFKAIFETSRNRLDFLCLLFGRPAPQTSQPWDNRPLTELLGYVDRMAVDTSHHRRIQGQLVDRIRSYGIAPAMVDFATIRRFHDEFVRSGLDLRFTTYGRGPRTYYPTIRQLYLEKDLAGKESSFLAREEDFRFVQTLERQGRIIPVVGDFGGARALRSIGRFLTERNLGVSLFYTSNVEFYLFRQGAFRRYVENIRSWPWLKNGLIVRSYFGGVMGQPHPQGKPGYASAQLLQTWDSFQRRTVQPDSLSYWELVTVDALELKP